MKPSDIPFLPPNGHSPHAITIETERPDQRGRVWTLGFLKAAFLVVMWMVWSLGVWGQCPTGVNLSMGGENLMEGDPVCKDAALSITLNHDNWMSSPDLLAVYWSANGSLTTASDVYNVSNATLIEEDIDPVNGSTSTDASDWTVDATGITTFYIYVVLDPDNPDAGCDPPVSFELNLAEIETDPLDQTACDGGTATFTVSLSYDDPMFTYNRWLYDSLGTSAFSVVPSGPTAPHYEGQFASALTIDPVGDTMSGWDFRLRVRYSKTGNQSGNYCEIFSDSANLSVASSIPDPSLNVTPNSIDFCSNIGTNTGTITIQNAVSGVTYVLRDPTNQAADCGIGDGSNLNLTFFLSSGTGTYTIEAGYGICGMNPTLACSTSLLETVTVSVRNVSADISGSDFSVCEGDGFTLDGSNSNDDGGNPSYVWEQSTDGTNFSSVGGNTDMLSVNSILQDTWYRLIFSSDFGDSICTDISATILVSLNSVDPGMIEAGQDICEGETPNNLNSTLGGDGSGSGTVRYRYESSTNGTTWTPIGSFGTSPEFNFPSIPSVTTMYRRVTRSTLGGVQCFATSNIVTITVNEIPTIIIDPISDFCSDDPADNFSVTVSPSNGSGSWSGPGITNGAVGTFDPSVAMAGDHDIQYLHTLTNNCSDSSTVTVTVNQTPILQDTTFTACVDDLIDFTALSVDNSNVTGFSFEYYNTENDALTGTSQLSYSDSIFTNPGSHEVFYRLNADGCIDVARIDISILPPPVASSISLTIDKPRICTGDTATIQICGLLPSEVYFISYDKQQTPPQDVTFTSDGNGCFYLPTNPIGSAGSFTYEIEVLEFSSGCGISPNPVPSNMKVDVQVNGRPDAGDIIDDLESPFCYDANPVYELSGLDNDTAYTIQYMVNGGSTQTFSGTTDGSGSLFPDIGSFTEDITVALLDIRFNDGDTECAADPVPDNSTDGTVRPDLSAITIIGDTICEDPMAEAEIMLQQIPFIDEIIDVTFSTSEGDEVREIPENSGPTIKYNIPFGVDVNAAQEFDIFIASISFRNSPECLDDATKNEDVIQVSERPIPNFDDSEIPCITHERIIGNLTEPVAARGSYAYQWIFEGDVIGTEETLVYNFPGRPASLALKLIAGSGDCIDSVTKDIFFDNAGPEIPEVKAIFRDDTDGIRLPGAILAVEFPDTMNLNYQWYNAGSMVTEKGNRPFLYIPSYDPLNPPNTYFVEASFKNPGSGQSDCGTRSELVRFGPAPPEGLAAELLLYPNPNDGTFQVHITGPTDGVGKLFIYDLQGRAVHYQEIEKNTDFIKQKISLPEAHGLYILTWQMPGAPLLKTKLMID